MVEGEFKKRVRTSSFVEWQDASDDEVQDEVQIEHEDKISKETVLQIVEDAKKEAPTFALGKYLERGIANPYIEYRRLAKDWETWFVKWFGETNPDS